ncbi:transmembrane protein 92-like [Cricetulus griseus]|uniref:Transmembrane protein 92-like n=1 Tax=Cricetulus griseus TaxID=10029 RepID=A0A9J7GL66_CRIGR|nr:transmembrane protein 92-like [Cricetulus griseus]
MMPEARIPDRALTLLFCLLSCLLSSLQPVSANQVKANCDTMILVFVSLAMMHLFFICGLMKCFCCKCRQPEQNLRSHHQTPPEALTTASLEIWVPTLDPPPPYDQVVMKPVEPPPPYSLMPEDPVGPMRDTENTAV